MRLLAKLYALIEIIGMSRKAICVITQPKSGKALISSQVGFLARLSQRRASN